MNSADLLKTVETTRELWICSVIPYMHMLSTKCIAIRLT